MRGHRKTILWVTTPVLVLPMLFVAGIYITHPRDEEAFLAALTSPAFPEDWRAFLDRRGSTFVLHEGDRACHWLSDQPLAGISDDESATLHARMDRYLDETSNVDPAWELPETEFDGRRLAAAAGWNHLCAATMLVHQPYHPWTDTDG